MELRDGYLRCAKFALALLLTTSCQYNYFEQAIDREKDTVSPAVSSSEPSAGSTIRKLEKLRLIFTEPVNQATEQGNYALSGAGVGTLTLVSINTLNPQEYELTFSGTMVDGPVTLQISGIRDRVGNEIATSTLEFTSSAVPKWRYIGRAVSTNTLVSSSAPALAYDSQYLYAAFNEIACVNLFNDITVMRYEFASGNWSTVGSRCIAGSTSTQNSINPHLLLHDGTLFVAFTDGSVFDGTNQFVQVRAFRNGNWELIGGKIGAHTRHPYLAAEGDNIYVSLRDIGNGSRVSVYRNSIATPGTWTLMGANGLSLGNTFRASPLVRFESEWYLAFRDGGSTPSSRPFVLKWDNSSSWASSWQIDTLAADNVNLLVTGSELWAIYQQGGTSQVAAQKFSGGSWSAALGNLATEGTPNYLSAGRAGSDSYVAYQVSTSSTCWVKQHNGTTWSSIGTSFNCGNPTMLLINSVVYVVFRDQDTGYMDRLSAAYFE
ncbi:MAG: hypothetical protein OHK0011_12330 [Turneriella sp.]